MSGAISNAWLFFFINTGKLICKNYSITDLIFQEHISQIQHFFRSFSAPLSNFRTFQVPKNLNSNFRTFHNFSGPVGTLTAVSSVENTHTHTHTHTHLGEELVNPWRHECCLVTPASNVHDTGCNTPPFLNIARTHIELKHIHELLYIFCSSCKSFNFYNIRRFILL